MSQLVIIGASAMGRETFTYATALGMQVKGFLDSRKNLLDDKPGYPPVLSSVEEYVVGIEDVFVCAVGDSVARRKFVELIEMRGGRFVSIIHPMAYVGQNVTIGDGCIICPNSTLTNDIQIGNHVIVNVNSSVSHDCSVGSFVTISPGCHIAGWCELKEDVFMGVHSAVVPHVSLGAGVFVAAGAVVTKSVDAGRVMGVPAILK